MSEKVKLYSNWSVYMTRIRELVDELSMIPGTDRYSAKQDTNRLVDELKVMHPDLPTEQLYAVALEHLIAVYMINNEVWDRDRDA